MKKLLGISIFILLLISCSEKRKTIIVNTHNANGFTTKSKLHVNGHEIGQIVKIEFAKNGTVNLICEIENNDIEIPTDSKFYSKELSLLGDKIIEIEVGEKKQIIEADALIKMSSKKNNKIDASFTKSINEVIAVLNGQHKADSLLYELRRLNKNIEELNQKQQN